MEAYLTFDKLTAAINSGRTDAIADFWRELAACGAPLIEPVEGDDDHSWVTFLWRGQAVQSVQLVSLLVPPGQGELQLITGTDVWYKLFKVRNNARLTYQFSSLPVDATMIKRNLQIDPLNPHIFDFFTVEEDPTGVNLRRSVLEMPNAPVQHWIEKRADVLTGQLDLAQVHSQRLNNQRRVWVYTPPGYDTEREKAYPLLLLFDGWTYLNLIPTPTILDNLIAAGEIPPLVAAFVDNLSMIIRLRELILHAPFNAFLVDELVPWLRRRYHITADPGRIVISGASAGGLAATYAALEYPQVFGKVLSQSGAFTHSPKGDPQDEWIARQFAKRGRLPIRFYMDVGDLENNLFEKGPASPNLLTTNRNLRDVLSSKGYQLYYQEFSGGHDQICWRGTLSDGLRYLLGG
jgi:enterochelin esterase-like enzyme